MADNDSDSSMSTDSDEVSTNVMLGYAAKDPTEDSFSRLGGVPDFVHASSPPGQFATCKVCNSTMSLLLQINGDLPTRLKGHERRLYLWSCRRSQCRRKAGSVRGFRSVKIDASELEVNDGVTTSATTRTKSTTSSNPQAKSQDLGSLLFGSDSNSFSNPFSTKLNEELSITNAKDQGIQELQATFAEKARISSPVQSPSEPSQVKQTWPSLDEFPSAYAESYIDGDYEYISKEATAAAQPSGVRGLMDLDDGNKSTNDNTNDNGADSDMSHDKTFQHFADRIGQNPDQVLRYEFDGSPLLYSKHDAVGRRFGQINAATSSKISVTNAKGFPPCGNCGGRRVFELQLMPHAIQELERDFDVGRLLNEGMEWGTIILGVCAKDCQEASEEQVSWIEEYVGVQWEEVVERRK